MPLENRNLEPGTVLSARYKKEDRTCEVVQTDAGLRYRLDDGTEHKSPSSAGKAVTGGVACNGWVFWSLAGAEKPKRERAAKAEKAAKAKKEPTTKKPTKAAKKGKRAKKPKAAKMASDASYACGVCSEAFPTMTAATEHALTHTA